MEVCTLLKASSPDRPLEEILSHLPATANSDLIFLVGNYLQKVQPSMKWSEIGWGLELAAAVHFHYLQEQSVEVVWTGPTATPNTFPIRRLDQVLYDLILKAKHHILLVTFAAAHIDRLKAALLAAVQRGVEMSLVLEFEEESAGQLSKDAIAAFAGSIEHSAKVYAWPLDQREKNPHGKPGKLHAKCAVVDEAALISSANLTDDAFNRNMELGVLVRGGEMPGRIRNHFAELIQVGVLIPWRQ